MIHLTDNLSAPVAPVSNVASTEARPDFAPNCQLPRHRWYRFKEGFSAGLVAEFVSNYLPTNNGRLLDPFLGSGTTAVEGARLGHQVDGMETNPFMTFMAKVKTRDYTPAKNLESAALECLRQRKRAEEFILPRDSTLVERKGLDKWLLNRAVAIRFEQVRTAIANTTPVVTRNLLFLALLASIEEVANARKDGKCWRYKRNWRNQHFNAKSLDEAFAGQVLRYADDIAACPCLAGKATVIRGDARKDLGRVGTTNLRYDGLLTSPPYLNSFDYTDIYRPELFLLNAARNSTELRKLRFNTLRSHVQVAWKPSASLDISLLQQKITAISKAGSWCGRIPEMINAYFVDLDRVIELSSQKLKQGATAGFVVAESAYCGVVIPVGQILEEIMGRRGFVTKKITVFRQTLGNGHHQLRSNEQLREFMLVAEFRGKQKNMGKTS